MRTKEMVVKMPWGEIRGQIFGSDDMPGIQPIVCLHGYMDNSNSFRPLASYLTATNEFYLVAIDLPGHGFSSPIPDGIPYTIKLLLYSLRYVVRYLRLTRFYLLAHSYGVFLSLLYQTVFRDEVVASISLDFIPHDKWDNLADVWKIGMENYMKIDEKSKNKLESKMSKEMALSILLKSNKSVDRKSAEILLERGLLTTENGKFIFSRDRGAQKTMMTWEHFSEFEFMMKYVVKNQTSPHLMIHAVPPSYGSEKSIVLKTEYIEKIKANSDNARIETVYLDGTHHFHMIRALDTSNIIVEFLNRISHNKHKNSKL